MTITKWKSAKAQDTGALTPLSKLPDHRDLLPLPLKHVTPQVRSGSTGRDRRRRKQKRRLDRHNQLVIYINSLSRGKVDDMHMSYGCKALSSGGQRSAARLLDFYGDWVCLHGIFQEGNQSNVPKLTRKFLDEKHEFSCTPFAPTKDIWLKPDKISLPPDNVAGSVPFLECLPPEIRTVYETPDSLISTEQNTNRISTTRPFIGAASDDYRKLIDRLAVLKMIELQPQKPLVVNGVFAVPKDDDKQRLIIDARNANRIFSEPPKVDLPNPGILSDLYVARGFTLYVAKSDIDNFYHRLLIPIWMSQYMGLPSVETQNGRMWPVLRALPMGWSHSVLVGQYVHLNLFEKAGIPLGNRISRTITNHEVGEIKHGAYLDDYFSLGTNAQLASFWLNKLIESGRVNGTPAKMSKVVDPLKLDSPEPTKVLGVMIYPDGTMRPCPDSLRFVVQYTTEFVKYRTWKKPLLASLMGKWAWFLLLRRPMFSILDKIYKLTDSDDDVLKPSSAARHELRALIALTPLIVADISKPMLDVVICTDASLKAGAAVYTKRGDLRPTFFLDSTQIERENWIQSKDWNTAIQHAWREKDHINILEGEAVVLALRWVLRKATNLGGRLTIFTDNQSLLGALRKGRSSSKSLNHICRRAAALVLGGDLKVDYFYVPSKKNPADDPSRFV